MLFEGCQVEGWLDYKIISTLTTYVTDMNYCLPSKEQDIFSLWEVLRIGNQNWLSQVDWAALTTVLLCKIIVGNLVDIVIAPFDEI